MKEPLDENMRKALKELDKHFPIDCVIVFEKGKYQATLRKPDFSVKEKKTK